MRAGFARMKTDTARMGTNSAPTRNIPFPAKFFRNCLHYLFSIFFGSQPDIHFSHQVYEREVYLLTQLIKICNRYRRRKKLHINNESVLYYVGEENGVRFNL